MPENNDNAKDARLRGLYRNAVAGAPAAPAIEEIRSRTRPSSIGERSTRRWFVSGAVGLTAVAAAVAGLLILPGDSREAIVNTPASHLPPSDATVPTVPTSTPATTPLFTPVSSTPTQVLPVGTEAPSTEPAAEPVSDGTSPASNETPVTTETRPTDPPPPVVAAGRPVLVSVGPGGVAVSRDGAEPELILDVFASHAVPAPSGEVYIQPDRDGAVTTLRPLVWDPSTGQVTETRYPAELAEFLVTMHDAALVGGRTMVLLSARSLVCMPDDCDGVLGVWTPGDGEWRELIRSWMWEWGYRSLSLADDGRIVGTSNGEGSVGPVTDSATSGSTLDLESLGIASDYQSEDGCNRCIDGLAIDATGTAISWVENSEAGIASGGRKLVVAAVDGTDRAEFEIPPLERAAQSCCWSTDTQGIEFSDDGSSIVAGFALYNALFPSFWVLDPVSGVAVTGSGFSANLGVATVS